MLQLNDAQSTFAPRLTLMATLLAFVVIILGAFTRLSDAGLSCPDWPNCYGYLTAPSTPAQVKMATLRFPATPVDIKKAWTEMVHRYFAGTEGILILFIACTLLIRREQPLLAIGLICLLALQIPLGMLTVTAKLKPIVVLSHLLTGIALLSLLTVRFLTTQLKEAPSRLPFKTIYLWIGFFLILLQIALGGWVSSHNAGLACLGFPTCNGQWWPTLQWQQWDSNGVTIHMMHRLGAIVVALYLTIFSIALCKDREWKKPGILLIHLVVLQFFLGMINVLWYRPIPIALLHQVTAILMLLTLIYLLTTTLFTPSSVSSDYK